MNKKENYHIYTHCDPLISDLGSFVSESESLGVGLNIVDLLNYQDENSNYNLDNLTAHYSVSELNQYSSLIQQIKSYRKTSLDVISATTSNTNNAIVSNSNVNLSSTIVLENYVKPKNISALQAAFKLDLTFINHPLTQSNKRLLDKLFNDDVKLLFQKFIYLIETTTDYLVEINNSTRTLQEQRQQIKKGNSKSDFSYHMVGLAIDIKLRHKEDSDLNLDKSSSKQEWIDEGIIAISNQLKLKWGGTFDDVENDVVHFDCRNYYIVNSNGYVNALKQKESTATTTSNTTTQNTTTQEQEIDNSPYTSLPIKMGTVLNLPIIKVDRSVLINETNQVVKTIDFESFLAKELVRLLSDKGYQRVFTPNKGTEFKGTVQEIYPHISVWVWSRSLSIKDILPLSNETVYEHQIVNITPYITSLNTSNFENGGNFNISVAPIVSELKSSGSNSKSWTLKENSQQNSKGANKYYVNSGHIHYVENNELKRSNLFFDKAFQENDVVFIKFEKLELEYDRKFLDELEIISLDKLPDQIFDMIGLIDVCSTSTNFESLDCSTSIVGRDLVKLLIEDGVYFYPNQFTDSGIFANTGATNNRLLRFNGEIKNRFQGGNRSIGKTLQFIMNNLGEIEICPSSLFDSYGSVLLNKSSSVVVDKRSSFYQLVNEQSQSVDEQLQKIADKKEKILERIGKVREKNNLIGTNISIYNIINSFLIQLIDNKSITVVGQKIKSWDYVIDNVVYKDRIPDSLDDKFIIFDKYWTKDQNQTVKNIREYSVISSLQDLNDSLDSTEIVNNNLILFSNLSRVLLKRKHQIFNNKIVSISSIISELDTYLKQFQSNEAFDDIGKDSLFSQSTLNEIKSDYTITVSQGHKLFLNVAIKLFDELSVDEQNIFNDIYNLIVEEQSINQNTVSSEQLRPMQGIWQIIKLVIDDSVKDRRLVDPSIGNENGSLLNAIRKVCQDPFCEFLTDTYGSQFYFIARKKPFDRESILSMLEGRVLYDRYDPVNKQVTQEATRAGIKLDTETVNSSLSFINQNLIIDIEEKDVLGDTLVYSREVYSWYKLSLANLTQGVQSTMAFAYLRAIYFEEFADIFGSKPLDLTTSYIPYSPVLDKKKELSNAYFIKQAVYDLKYMIESHCYLPFTRMGTLRINGDRRIKRGTFVRLKSTNEIFYVDGVSNSYSVSESEIDRETVLQVSRGMIEKYIKGVNYVHSDGSTQLMSYFNICQLDIDEKIFEDKNSSFSSFSEGSLANWKVNKAVFNFFLKRLQAAKNNE